MTDPPAPQMTEGEHAAMRESFYKGTLQIGVNREVALMLLVLNGADYFHEQTGEWPHVERTVVKTLLFFRMENAAERAAAFFVRAFVARNYRAYCWFQNALFLRSGR